MLRYKFSIPDWAMQTLVRDVTDIIRITPTKNAEGTCVFGKVLSITRDGIMVFADTITKPSAERLVAMITNTGYEAHEIPEEAPQNHEIAHSPNNENNAGCDGRNTTSISLDKSAFDERSLANLHKLLDAKGDLICKSLNMQDCSVKITENAVTFPWTNESMPIEERYFTEQFVRKICEFCIKSKRINSRSKETDNEKFTMRVFLNRIGMTGDEFKKARLMLLRHLDGSSAWRHGAPVK